jgi:mRNA interferase YafQ
VRKIVETSKFKSDLRKISKSGRYDIDDLVFVIQKLCDDVTLPPRFHDHELSGNWSHFRECHIKPDWLLIYKFPDGHLKIPHLWPGQNPPPRWSAERV